MFNDTLTKLGNAAEVKGKFSKKTGQFLVASCFAGFYVGLGIILIMTVGSLLGPTGTAFTKIMMGMSFGIALSLVVMAGSELYTGNNLIVMAGALDKRISWRAANRIWVISFIGNFIGSIVVAGIFYLTGLTNGPAGEFIIKVASAKMSGAFFPLMAKGILCNILVCLAVTCSIRMQSESGKLIMIWWCLFAFITAGFEHSIANMTIFSIALFMPHPETVSLMGMAANLIPVTLGNFIGGALILGTSFYYVGKKDK